MNMTSHAFQKNQRSEGFDFSLSKRIEHNKTTDLLAEDSKSNNLGMNFRKSRSAVRSREGSSLRKQRQYASQDEDSASNRGHPNHD